MGVRSILRAVQQSLPKRISSIFSSDFTGLSLSGSVMSNTRRRWSFLRGNWALMSSKLNTSSVSSDYPITVVDALVPDVEIELKDLGQGVGAALWVTDAGNWWSVSTEQRSESCNCTTYYYDCGCSTCGGSYCSSYYCSCGDESYNYDCTFYPGGCGSFYCTETFGNYCSAYYANGNCKEYTKVGWTDCLCDYYYPDSTYCTYNYYPGTSNCCCAEYFSYPCGCSTCSAQSCQTCYPQYIRILQSAANTVSEIVKWQVNNIVRSLRVRTSNKNIEVTSYSDSNLATQIDSRSHNATSATESTKFGIVISPSPYNENKSISEINIERGV